MGTQVHSFLREPRSPGAPIRVGRDWLLVAAMVVTTVTEVLVRPRPSHLGLTLVAMAVLILSTLFRRSAPLASVAASFGTLLLVNVWFLIIGHSPSGLYSSVWGLVLGYSLFRWGSGKEIAGGTAIMMSALLVGTVGDYTGPVDAIGSAVVLFFPAAIGASVRLRQNSIEQQVQRIKSLERERIARELHDTVAHHVSAIAIAAQAGRSPSAVDPLAGATTALELIEEEASRTLVEMRAMIGLLRSETDLAPMLGVDQLSELARLGTDESPRVEVEVSGSLDSISESVSTTIFRLSQESVTNAIRHAPKASLVRVRVEVGSKSIRLTVSDDGAPVPPSSVVRGFGLVGMKERVNLLGGTFIAGPGSDQGWVVAADLPLQPAAS